MRDKAYDNYISTHWKSIHPDAAKEFDVYYNYFKCNFLAHLPGDRKARILDVGCGMGHFLYFLQKEGYENFTGIDRSPENVKFCVEHGLHAEQHDVFEYLGEGKVFDAMVMNDFLEHFTKDEAVHIVELAYKCLAQGGILILKVPNAANPIVGSSSRYIDLTHESSFTEESLSQLLKICGLHDIKIYPPNIYLYTYNPLNYLAKVVAWLSFKLYRLLFILYGRKSTKIFTKDLIAIACKG
jgi:2-polyprenyl-3-methyl-5-hydroxy-6-metoxy-1,4-benzoquinol methylase